MSKPSDILFSRVDWKCVECGVSAAVGCGCYERRKAKAIEREFKKLMKLSDADLLAECQRLGVKLDKE